MRQATSTFLVLLGLASGLALGLASMAKADPRWWWHDRPVAPAGEDRQWPHLAGGGGQGGAGEGGGLFLVYSEWDPAEGDWELYLTTTPNLGCHWCDPVRLTDNAVDDMHPRVASAILADGHFSIQVVFEQAGDVVVAYDTLVPAWDPPEQLCTNLAALGPRMIAGSQYRTLNSVPGTASVPDISVGSLFGSFNHFHAVWQDTRTPAESDIYSVRDLAGRGGAGWSAEMLLTPGAVVAPLAESPALSADIFTQVPADSAANLAFLDRASGAVRFLRSVDSGLTWFPVGAPSGALSDPGATAGGRPALDSARSPWSTDTPLWHCAAWEDHGGTDPVLFVDSQFNDTAVTGTPAWGVDELLRGSSSPGVAGPSISVLPGAPEDSPVLLFWTDPQVGQGELFYRGGRLGTTAPDSMNFSALPFQSQRPKDPVVSSDFLLTSCAVDEATLDCLSTRVMGDASQSTAEGDFTGTFVVWRDTREGVGNIFFKRSDEWAWLNTATLSARCSDPATAELTVEWTPPATCATQFWASERMERYLVFYGTDPGGPYLNAASPFDIPYDPLVLTHRLTIPGLTPGTTYHVIVVPEDEARNLYPADFDPAADNGSPPNETNIAAPALCEPILRASCAILGDRCAEGGPLHDDGQADFGELLDLEVTLTNVGTMAATDYLADLLGGIAAVVLPPSGSVSVASIPAGQSITIPFTVRLPGSASAACGDPIDIDLVNQSSDAGLFLFPASELASCDLAIGDPTPPCGECGAAPLVAVQGMSLTADVCLGDPASPGAANGAADPGERVTLELSFRNIGTLAATDYQGTLAVVSGASLVSGGSIGPVTLAPDAVFVHVVELDVSAACGELVDLDLSGLTSDSGARVYPDEPTAADLRVGSELTENATSHVDSSFLWIADGGGPAESFLGTTTWEPAPVDSAILRITSSSFQDPADTVLTLVGPQGTIDATAVMLGDLDVTADYNGVLGGAGTYRLRVEDTTADGNPDSWLGSWQLDITDWTATCEACVAVPCAALSFSGDTTATPVGDCSLEVDWAPALGEGLVTYDLFRDGSLLVAGLAGAPFLDAGLSFGASHSYRVEAVDSCANPLPQRASNNPSPAVAVEDRTGPSIASPSLSYAGAGPGDCAVTVDGTPAADCAGIADLSILRGAVDPPTLVVASGVGLPFVDPAPGDGRYFYRIRARDQAGNVTETPTMSVDVSSCQAVCLFRSAVADRTSLDPAAVFQMPRSPMDIGLQGAAFRCAVTSGELDVGAVDATDLIFYQIDVATPSLRVFRQGSDLRIDF